MSEDSGDIKDESITSDSQVAEPDGSLPESDQPQISEPIQVALTTDQVESEEPTRLLRQKTRRSLLVGGLAAGTGILGWRWMLGQPNLYGLPWPLRNALDFTSGIFEETISYDRQAPEFSPIVGTDARVNADIGLSREPNYNEVTFSTGFGSDSIPITSISLEKIHNLPRIEQTIEFKCIEGWSEVMSFAGARFSELLEIFSLGRRPDGSLYPYVGLATSDREYYVSIDIESMLHLQTQLSYEMNGSAITAEHGAPLRLCIPLKYGIKNLKQVAHIYFSDHRPPDYWHERGYDWHSSL